MKRITLLILTSFLAISLCACNSSDYGNAEKLFSQGNFQEAKAAFSQLGDYKDSATMVLECDYQLAQQYFMENDWENARSVFSALGNYEDAMEKVQKCRYCLGKQAYENEDWTKAIEFLSALNYSDSETMLAVAQREKGMTENADYAFLSDLETSVRYRMSESETDTAFSELVETELSYVGKYEDLEFYDKELKALAQQYIEGLNLQEDSEEQKYTQKRHLLILEGLVKRFDALSKLSDQYGFLEDDAEFTDTYVSELEYWNGFYNGYLEILADIDRQIQDFKDARGYYWYLRWNRNTMSDWVNNTGYTYTISFACYFHDESDTNYAIGIDTKENIAPGQTYQISIQIPEIDRFDYFTTDYYLHSFESDVIYSDITHY